MNSILCVHACSGEEESSHQDEQERFNENHLENSIHAAKSLRYLLVPCLEKSEPSSTRPPSGGRLGHQEEMAAWQVPVFPEFVGRNDAQLSPVLPAWLS